MNNYNPNINLTIEINLKKFLYTQFITKNGRIETAFYRRSTKLPVLWWSNIPKRYNRNQINADLHCWKRFSTNCDREIYQNKKFIAVSFTQKLLEKVIRNFENDKVESVEDDYITPPGFVDIAKPVIIKEVPFCTKNEISSKQCRQKFHNLTGS